MALESPRLAYLASPSKTPASPISAQIPEFSQTSLEMTYLFEKKCLKPLFIISKKLLWKCHKFKLLLIYIKKPNYQYLCQLLEEQEKLRTYSSSELPFFKKQLNILLLILPMLNIK